MTHANVVGPAGQGITGHGRLLTWPVSSHNWPVSCITHHLPEHSDRCHGHWQTQVINRSKSQGIHRLGSGIVVTTRINYVRSKSRLFVHVSISPRRRAAAPVIHLPGERLSP
jgi:hypothetical protein